MNIVIMNDSGEPECYLRASDFLDHWFWDMEKTDRFSAYLDLIFRADDDGILITSTRLLSWRWKITQEQTRKMLRLLKRHEFINYERADHGRVKITIRTDTLSKI
jgi:hypothetical protein